MSDSGTVHISNVIELTADHRISSLYDFWLYVHTVGFPKNIKFGKLESYGIDSRSLLVDIVSRDIDSRFKVIPKDFEVASVTFEEGELGDEAKVLKDYLSSYLTFRGAELTINTKPKPSVPTVAPEANP